MILLTKTIMGLFSEDPLDLVPPFELLVLKSLRKLEISLSVMQRVTRTNLQTVSSQSTRL
uniref:Riboflavin biosynthesis protein ribAB n=1 Tax=Arundo donax TaxID=35708 RepID=A0A0A9HEP0_ARUDO